MVFTSISFAIFLPVIFLIYWAVPKTKQWMVLFVADIIFYMYGGPVYILLMAFVAGITYLSASRIASGADDRIKKRWLVSAVVLVVLALAFFKYALFLQGTLSGILSLFSVTFTPSVLKIALPLGISFYSFAALGYVIDVYRGDTKPESNFFKYSTFVAFFPTVLSGPINRADDILPVINSGTVFDYDLASRGLRQMLWGIFKKLIIADMLAKYADIVFDDAKSYFGLTLITATVFYTFQIYCDFSGYSDIATGTAALLGIKVRDNFKSPYYSKSVKEFWGRWHISLSQWFRDYVYIPLGGSRVKPARHRLNIMLTMLLSGLWHGADWSFVIWGGLHGIYQVIEDILRKLIPAGKKEKGKAARFFSDLGHGILTFGMVSFAWSFFRANDTSDALYIATHMHRGLGHFAGSWIMMLNNMHLDTGKVLWALFLVLLLMAVDAVAMGRDIYAAFGKLPVWVRWIVYTVLTVFTIVLTLNGGHHQEFIYFQF